MKRILDFRFPILDSVNPKSEIRNPKSQGRNAIFVTSVVLLSIGLPALVMACPLCKEALFSPGEAAAQSRVVQGYAISIAALLGIPILLVGGITLRLIRSARHTRAAALRRAGSG
jgi:hypothetical protein